MERVENGTSQTELRIRLQLIAALGLLIMAIAAPIALQLLRSADSADSIRVAVLLFVVVVVLDVVIAWSFWFLFEETDRRLSALSMLFRVVYSVLLMTSLGVYAPYLSQSGMAFDLPSVYSHFDLQWNLGLAVFGLHLVTLGLLFLKAKEFHIVLGALILVAGLGYVFDSVANLVAPQTLMTVSSFTFLGEALLIVWLPAHALRLKRSLPLAHSEVAAGGQK